MDLSPEQLSQKEPLRFLGVAVGAIISAAGMNLFVVPAGLYSGGVMGICQLIRTFLVQSLHLNLGSMDIAGILYYIANIPLLLIAWKQVEHRIVAKTIVFATCYSLAISLIPVYDLMEGDRLTKCLIGGIVSGAGSGIALWTGGTSGGMDAVGIMLLTKGSHISVGQINLFVNVVIYAVCAVLFQLPTAIYSIIFAFINSTTKDRLHTQNINVEVTVITKIQCKDMEQEIMQLLRRGITKVQGEGEYTHEPVNMLYVVVSKFEVARLRGIIRKHDPRAFVVVKPNAVIYGNYAKKF